MASPDKPPDSPVQLPPKLIRAAEYVRMSTEHQQYSTENQSEVIRQYAARRGMTIVRTYADAGKSGLRIDGRNALKQLIQDATRSIQSHTSVPLFTLNSLASFAFLPWPR